MIIRNMNEKDIAQVCTIENETFSRPWKEHDFLSAINGEDNIYLVVEEEGQILAYCGLWGVIEEGHINNVAVKKEFHKRGIASKMLKELIERGRKKGLESFTLEVRIGNVNAIRLYEKLGFEKIGIRPSFYDKPREDGLVMWLY